MKNLLGKSGFWIAAVLLVGLACGPSKSPLPAPSPSPEPISRQSLSIPALTSGADDSIALMYTALDLIFSGDGSPAEIMAQRGDRSFVPVLIEFLRFPWELKPEVGQKISAALTRLTGETFGGEWDLWLEWLGKNPEITPPKGFASWKGRLLSRIDPDMGAFLDDSFKTRIRIEEIVWGGVVKDGIPDLQNPPALRAKEATYLLPSDRVFGVFINGEHRAYPLRILNAHEMANDVVGGTPIALAY